MKWLYPASLVISATTLVFSVACDGDDSTSSTISARIAEYCSSTCATAKSLNCPAEATLTVEDCEARCKSIGTAQPKCLNQYEAYLACGDSQPIANWECDIRGESDVKVGFCDNEYLAMDTCVSAN